MTVGLGLRVLGFRVSGSGLQGLELGFWGLGGLELTSQAKPVTSGYTFGGSSGGYGSFHEYGSEPQHRPQPAIFFIGTP